MMGRKITKGHYSYMVGLQEIGLGGDDLNLLKDKHSGSSAAIVAPGTSLELENRKDFSGKVVIGVNEVSKLLDIDYLVVRDYDKIDSISCQFGRREKMTLICDRGVYSYVQWNPIQSRIMGEDIKKRFSRLKSFFVDDSNDVP